MPHAFEFLVAVAFRGWFAAAAIAGAAAFALNVTIRSREALGRYAAVSLCLLIAQIAWALFAIVSTNADSISGAACLSGIWGVTVLPPATVVDLTALSIAAYSSRLAPMIWVKLALTRFLLGFVVFCAVLRSAVLCTV